MDVDNSISDSTVQSAGVGSRFNEDPSKIVYKNLYQFRINQAQDGVDLSGLTDVMWGLVPLHRCHHVSCVTNTNHSAKRSPTQANTPESDFPLTTYRVRICKTCCGETGHIELGTYNDQESAMLVNDAFEIMQGRYNRLLVLRPEDQQYFDRLYVQRCDRSKGKEQVGLLEVIAERRRHSTSQSTSSSTVASLESRKRSSPASGLSFNDLGSSAKRQARSALSSSASVTSEESTSRPSSKGDNVGTKFPANQNDEDYSDDEDSSSSPASLEEGISSSTAMDTQDIVSPPLVKQEPRISPNSALKLMDDNAYPNLGRQRSYTFSTASEYFPALNSMQSGMETLTWLASLDEREVDVARSLFALAHQEYPSSAEESRSGAEEISKVAATSVPVTSAVQRERSDSFAEIMGEKNLSKPASAKVSSFPSNNMSNNSFNIHILSLQKQVVIMTPRKDSVTSEDGEGQEFAVVDRLSLLTRSAGLLASPVQRNGYPIVLSPLRSLGQSQTFSGLDDPPILPPSSYRRPRSQSMSAIDPPNNGFNSTNGINAANILKSNVNGKATIYDVFH